MKDDNQGSRPRKRFFRYAVFSLAAALVLSLGFALIPAEPPPPAEPPFSEQARAAAFDKALELRTAGLALAASGPPGTAVAAPVDHIVMLLTVQARALLVPPAEGTAVTPAAVPTAGQATPGMPLSPAASGSAPDGPAPSASPSPAAPNVSEFVQSLASSGADRLRDAETADGGMARLLAGAGTAQLLAAGELAAAAGVQVSQPSPPAAGVPASAAGSAAATCASAPPETTADPGHSRAEAGAALAAAALAEQEAVYGYQAALPRLAPGQAGPASEFLEQHQALAVAAEAWSREACGAPPLPQPGFVLAPDFLNAPAAGLGRLEAATLPAYGDTVALTAGPTRAWALLALQEAARRAMHWGSDPGPVPGLPLDAEQLPPLPE